MGLMWSQTHYVCGHELEPLDQSSYSSPLELEVCMTLPDYDSFSSFGLFNCLVPPFFLELQTAGRFLSWFPGVSVVLVA